MEEYRAKNIIISGTNFWNPGDDFVRDGVIRILRELFLPHTLNFLFYNFNQDFFPQNKFAGISNLAAKGDMEQYRDFIDAVVIAGLSAGQEIKDLYSWIIDNNLQDRVYLIGAGYENSYVGKYIYEEPEATIFKNARIITGRTKKVPRFIPELNLPYYHINCPAILSVPDIKKIQPYNKITKIGFSIQLPHGLGIPNQCCAEAMYNIAVNAAIELSKYYCVEIIAHHKSEYFHFLNLFKALNISIRFSSFYQELFSIYPQYDVIITTRLHSSLFGNGFGIPGIIINDTDRHSHCLDGFPHSTLVNSFSCLKKEMQRLLACNLAAIATEAEQFKNRLLASYVKILEGPFKSDKRSQEKPPAQDFESDTKSIPSNQTITESFSGKSIHATHLPLVRQKIRCPKDQTSLPISFFTIVLNGKPFIQKHIETFRDLPLKWHWHIVEGVADLRHDTAWSLQNGARITDDMHRNGRSNDGTSEYLDELALAFPRNITIYRKPEGEFWDGKLEMVNAPLNNILEECLLWQIDADEIWTTDQLIQTHSLFLNDNSKTAAYFTCRFFVGDDLIITSKDTYGNNSSYEWLRTWRFTPGDKWGAHEPPRLLRKGEMAEPIDVAAINPILHDVTEENGLIFDHYAYVLESQLKFKESYYGYSNAVASWKKLQDVGNFPTKLRDYFPWVKDDALVDRISSPNKKVEREIVRILWVRTDSIGDNILAMAMLPSLRDNYPNAEITVLCQQHIVELYEACPLVNRVIGFNRLKALQDDAYRTEMLGTIQAIGADLALNPVYSREPLTDLFTAASGARQRFALEGNLCNISAVDRERNNRLYTGVLSSEGENKTELERHKDFLRGLGTANPRLELSFWVTPDDMAFAKRLFRDHDLTSEKTVALFAGAQHAVRLYDHYGTALADICQANDFAVLALGAAGDQGINQLNLDAIGTRVVNLSGALTLRQSAALLSLCRLAVGAETGLAHMACAVETPNVILLGGGHFGRFMPYSPLTSIVALPLECYGCNWQCRYNRVHCVRDVAPSAIEEAVRQTLAQTSDKPRLFVASMNDRRPGNGEPHRGGVMEFISSDAITVIPLP